MQKKTVNSLIRAVAVIGASSMLLAGCSNPAASTDNTDTSAAGYWPEVSTSLDGVTLTLWTGASEKNYLNKAIEGFEKLTGATVNTETIPDSYENNVQTKVTTGDMPDLALWQPTTSMLAGFVSQGKLQALDNAPFESAYKDGLGDIAGKYNGKRYALLFSSPSVIGAYYNKHVFEAAGIDSMPQNWDELVADAEKIKAAGIDGLVSPLYEMGGSQWGTQWAVQVQLAEAAKDGLWDRVNENKEKFTDSTIMEAINNYNDLFKQGLYNANAGSAKDTDQEQALLDGKTGIIFGNRSQFTAIQAMADNNIDTLNDTIGYFPISKDGTISTLVPDTSGGMIAFKTGDAKRESAARQFMNYLVTDGYEDFITDQNLPSIMKAVDSPSTVPQAILDATDAISNSVGSMQMLAIANPDLYINLANMVNGTMTPEEVASVTQDQFSQVAKAQGAKGF
ncbi:ABC transporter substrate-binding protein [Bifidobacterium goeldii]|nr:extracellular solute-binding protein [Bifidobacterium goeldii]